MNLPEQNVQQFIRTAFERHRIYILKELGVPKPWTASHVFGSYYFCNVFRRIDKTSKWIIDNVIEPNEDNPDLWKWIILARYISRIDTLKHLNNACVLGKDLNACQRILRRYKEQGGRIVTNAFIVNSATSEGYADKITHLFRTIKFFQDQMTSAPMDIWMRADIRSLQGAYNRLILAPGCGPFMAYQYVCDTAYSKRYLAGAPDQLEWAQLGLGAMRGMNRILGNDNIRGKVPNALECVQELYYKWHQWCTPSILRDEREGTCNLIPDVLQTQQTWDAVQRSYEMFTELKLCDVQHWLCEYDKYMRGGSKKRKYDGGLHAD